MVSLKWFNGRPFSTRCVKSFIIFCHSLPFDTKMIGLMIDSLLFYFISSYDWYHEIYLDFWMVKNKFDMEINSICLLLFRSSRWSCIFFILYVLLGVYFVTNLILAVVYDSFKAEVYTWKFSFYHFWFSISYFCSYYYGLISKNHEMICLNCLTDLFDFSLQDRSLKWIQWGSESCKRHSASLITL